MTSTIALPHFITQMRAQLADLEEAFGLPKDSLPDWERSRELVITRTCDGETFERCFTASRVAAWFDCLGADLTIRITVTDEVQGDQTYQLDSHALAPLPVLLEYLHVYEVDRVAITCNLLKLHLTEHLGSVLGLPFDGLFFFPSTLEHRINLIGAESLFEAGTLHHERHSVIGVLGAAGLLQGQYVTVIGLDDATQPDTLRLPSLQGRIRAWTKARALRDSSATWTGFLSSVDPFVFDVRELKPGLNHIFRKVNDLSGVLSLLQFCTTVTQPDGQSLRATVARPSGTSITVVGNRSSSVLDTDDENGNLAARRAFRWAFSGDDYDKVDIMRDLIEREVRGRQDDAVRHLKMVMPHLLEAGRATYKVIRTHAFETYLQAREEAKSKVSSFVAESRASIDKLRTDMVNRALQFFAAIIAYLAISVVKPGLPTRYKVIGVLFGVVYIVLIGIFQMAPAWFDYRNERQEAENAVNSNEILTPTERDRIICQLPSGFWSSFTRWFVACGVFYGLGVIALLATLFVFLTKG